MIAAAKNVDAQNSWRRRQLAAPVLHKCVLDSVDAVREIEQLGDFPTRQDDHRAEIPTTVRRCATRLLSLSGTVQPCNASGNSSTSARALPL
jgi:hypothetical protein